MVEEVVFTEMAGAEEEGEVEVGEEGERAEGGGMNEKRPACLRD